MEVLNLSKKMQADGVYYLFEMNGYEIFEPFYKGNISIGMPKFIMYNKKETREATEKEINEIMNNIKDE